MGEGTVRLMEPVITYPKLGRGAWPSDGLGGTLSLDGLKLGKFYRAPAKGSTLPMIGVVGFRAARGGLPCSINDYAAYRAVIAVQTELDTITADGIWGPRTDLALKEYQAEHGLTADGIFGSASARALFHPMLLTAIGWAVPRAHPELADLCCGHIALESVWDPGAVGKSTPQDLGLGQINGPAWPSLSANDRLNPAMSLPWMARFVQANLAAFPGDTRAGVFAYNAGVAGCRKWIAEGRPDVWGVRRPNEYIDKVLAGC